MISSQKLPPGKWKQLQALSEVGSLVETEAWRMKAPDGFKSSYLINIEMKTVFPIFGNLI